MSLKDHTSRHRRSTWVLVCTCYLWVCAGLSAQDFKPEATPNPFVIEGYALLEAGNSDGALEAFEKALALDTSELPARLGQAIIYAEQQNHEKAFICYDTIIQDHPRHVDAWSGRGLAAYNLEDFDEALNSFKQATFDQPVNGFYYESLAWTQMCRGDFESAATSSKTATLMYGRQGKAVVYPLLIAYFANSELGDEATALRTLAYAQKNSNANVWPAQIIDYLSGKINHNELISYVMDSAEETEAHAYIGLKLRLDQQNEAAQAHLDWVSSHGDTRVFEYTLARAMKLRESVAVLGQ
ncbi:MAG: tetratricopeptide repeat protein [Opitutaceae bacterium]